ncbi:hypothetical protein [Actinomadura sp. 7K534]|uniref:hypothetical protein n=1 Tax=Actinomadura sp. 7K534 TaxID=2530366 RepID=UPI001044C4C6|nr:hypothetical protein [Actinomadura sp. 7K534]TDB92237.1 hypothetical protein E1266_24965 [Actinomadura sp. 7K534]
MRRVPTLAASLSGLLLLTGCANDGPVKVDPPTAGAGGSARPANATGTFAKEGWFGSADGLHARVEIKGIERQGAKSVLRYSVTSMDTATKSVMFAIDLLDPVGRRLYRPTGSTSGDGFAPGTTREMAAEYPALPPDVTKLTVLTPGSAGEFTGIPVTGTATASPSGSALPTATAPPPGAEPGGSAPPGVGAGVDAGTDEGTGTEPEAGVEAETATDGPSGAPTGAGTPTITASAGTEPSPGSSPGPGNPVVLHDIIEKETGDASSSPSPGASSSGSASASASSSATSSPSATASDGAAGTPADFRPEDGEKVASRSTKFGEAKRRMDVKPFYRDGAYIVAVFDIVNEGPGPTPPDASYPHTDYPGGVFTAFSIKVKGGMDVYRAVRIGPGTPGAPGSYLAPGRAVFTTEVNQPVRGFVYLPAPPGNASSVTFDAGPFGTFDDVPVQ